MTAIAHFLGKRLAGGRMSGFAHRSLHRFYSRQAQAAYEKAVVPDFPRNMDIELTNACNLQCPMCPRTDVMTRKIANIKVDLMKKIMDEIETVGLHRLYLHVFGEAILHPRWPDLIREAARKTIRKVELSLNGVLLTEEKSRQLLDSPLTGIYLSIDSVSPEVFNEVRAGGDLARLLENVKTLIRLHREKKSAMRMELQVIDFPQFKENVHEFIRYFAPYLSAGEPDGISIRIKSYIDYAGQVDYVKKHRPLSFETPCTWTIDRCTVLSNGDVVACCMDVNGTLQMGNVARQSLREIWKSETYTNLRQAHLQLALERYPLCQGCEIRMKEWPTGRSVHGERSTFIRTRRQAGEFLSGRSPDQPDTDASVASNEEAEAAG